MFLTPPPTLTEDFRKIDLGLSRKKTATGEKFLGSLFKKNWTVFGENFEKLMVLTVFERQIFSEDFFIFVRGLAPRPVTKVA